MVAHPGMAIWEHGWVRVTAHTSHTVRGTQESIAKLRDAPTRRSGHPRPPNTACHPIQPALQQYSAKTCCIVQYSEVSVSRAHCNTIQQYSAIQRHTAIQPYITIQYAAQYTPPQTEHLHGVAAYELLVIAAHYLYNELVYCSRLTGSSKQRRPRAALGS